METIERKLLPSYMEVRSGDTVYKVTSIFSEKGDLCSLWKALVIDRITRLSDCKSV